MIQISNIKIAAKKDQKAALEKEIHYLLHLKPKQEVSYRIQKKSIDARKKESIFCIYTVLVDGGEKEAGMVKKCGKNNSISIVTPKVYKEPVHGTKNMAKRPVVVGSGPAGLFAAYLLAKHGFRPILLERGADVDQRTKDVEAFWETGILNPKSNVQFGEGGAGTFSDGKLNSVIKDIRCQKVLGTFVEYGAPEEIAYLAKPHIGTDNLKTVVKNIRKAIEEAGGTVRFLSQVTGIETEAGTLSGLVINGEEHLPAEVAILAIGHSARDTFETLHKEEIEMEQKAFAIGLRMEHLQKNMNLAQYGMEEPYEHLGAADYKVTYQAQNGRAVYSFCMCPGGSVVAAASEEGRLAVNGMSQHARDGRNANSAIVVNVEPKDFPGKDVMDGVRFQRTWEEAAYNLTDGYRAPVQLTGDFLKDQPSKEFGTVLPTYRPGTQFCELKNCLPSYVTEAIREAIPAFGKKIRGFDDPDTLLTGVETRTSSPVRIVRNAEYESPSVKGLYPCGEGAGYAGGIMSAAVDGLRIAETIISAYDPKSLH